VCGAATPPVPPARPSSATPRAWAPRIKTGYDALLNSALKGKGAMGAQGGGDYSDYRNRPRRGLHGQPGRVRSLREPKAPAAAASAGTPAPPLEAQRIRRLPAPGAAAPAAPAACQPAVPRRGAPRREARTAAPVSQAHVLRLPQRRDSTALAATSMSSVCTRPKAEARPAVEEEPALLVEPDRCTRCGWHRRVCASRQTALGPRACSRHT
jgi:hypothetical protein